MASNSPAKPVLVIVAGPNGSGKTSLTTCMESKRLVVGEWINPDEIAQADFGGWNDPTAILLAAKEAEQRRNKAFQDRRDFTFEAK
jgi:predicted ABC-type ATPase